ncbi:lysostaphin resistance A-like protein [Neobacillus sp. NPDC093127]|uniref:CPBP family intramembrane glutamic endopeptidase n=1 Tax=Neobacillus sp. NPDC093127 TaxID=3364296 RepID=UPI00380290D8
MTTNLTRPISKKLLFSILVVTIGAEVLLYLTRYSSMAGTLYDALMVSSFFIGLKLYRRLGRPEDKAKTKRQLMLQFTGAFLIFSLGSTLNNVYSTFIFQDFSDDYDQYVQDYADMQAYDPGDVQTTTEPVWAFFEKVDLVGYDIFADILAGLEEVWRLAYIIFFLMIFKRIFRKRWESGRRDLFLMAALFLTSILFGIDHTLAAEQPWSIKIGAIITFANMGLLLGFILLWTRNLWVIVLVHALYDITATLSWYYVEYAVERFAIIIFGVHLILFTLEKVHQRRLNREMQTIELQQTAEVFQNAE